MKKVIVLLLMVLAFAAGWWGGEREGADSGARQMAQHVIAELEDLRQRALSWQYAAEHYAGICKWLLSDKPIYGSIVMDSNTTLRDCLIVSGSKEAAVSIEGANGYITNNYFMAIDMDWVLSTTAIEPNEYEDIAEVTATIEEETVESNEKLLEYIIIDENGDGLRIENCTFLTTEEPAESNEPNEVDSVHIRKAGKWYVGTQDN